MGAAVGAAAGGQIYRRCWRKKVAKPPDPSWEGAAVVFNREREASAEEESLLVVGEEAGSGIVRGSGCQRKKKKIKKGRICSAHPGLSSTITACIVHQA